MPWSTVGDIVGQIDLVVLQGTSVCNLNCSYCYLSPQSRRTNSSLPLSYVNLLFEKILSSRFIGSTLQISWHSGEPLTLEPLYYRTAIKTILELRDSLVPNLEIRFDIQTNGTLIDQNWCHLFTDFRTVLNVGISCDGPADLHNIHRKNWAGQGTHAQVVRGMNLLRAHGILFDVISVISLEGLRSAHALIEFFATFDGSIREFHFNLHDELGDNARDETWLSEYKSLYELFLRELLAACGTIGAAPRVRNFAGFYEMALHRSLAGTTFDARVMSWPFKSLNVQANGDVSTFYAGLTGAECPDLYGDGKGLIVGNLLTETLEQIANSPKLARIWKDFEASHSACKASCSYYEMCSGGYNLVKMKRFGTFQVSETPECAIHVKTFSRVLLEELMLRSATAKQDVA